MASPLLTPIFLLTNQLTLNDLEAVKAHVASLISGLAPAEGPSLVTETPLLTLAQIRQEVIKMETRTAYKASWKRFVNKGRMIENVFAILEECYSSLRRKQSNKDGWEAARALGGRQTVKWQQFKIRVIQYLHDKGSFHNGCEGYRDFEDTADGCDEITWDAACYLLVHPETTPA